jgi:hypothetical protein
VSTYYSCRTAEVLCADATEQKNRRTENDVGLASTTACQQHAEYARTRGTQHTHTQKRSEKFNLARIPITQRRDSK